jgi:hypothetical protein
MKLFIIPLRAFGSLDPPVLVSSVKLARARFDRKNLSGKSEKPANLSANSNVRLVVVVDVIVVDVDNGPVDIVVIVVGGGIAAVASGRMAIVGDVSIGMTRAGFLINDKNRCRHKSSGISELSTSNSRNCRKL